jgi:hypothetical protein
MFLYFGTFYRRASAARTVKSDNCRNRRNRDSEMFQACGTFRYKPHWDILTDPYTIASNTWQNVYYRVYKQSGEFKSFVANSAHDESRTGTYTRDEESSRLIPTRSLSAARLVGSQDEIMKEHNLLLRSWMLNWTFWIRPKQKPFLKA